jgi:heterodisulfide reductase subunit D
MHAKMSFYDLKPPSMSDFQYAAYFRRIQDLKKLQVKANDVSWLEQHRPPDRAYDIVLYLGCNILRTPHIARQVVDVFTHLNLDFVAVGGVYYCCGIVHDKFDGPKKGGQVSDRSVARLEDYHPRQVVMWCPSCNVHFKDIVIGRDQKQPRFSITHTPQLLAEMCERGQLAWKQAVPCKVALHTHVGRTDHEEGQSRSRNDRESVTRVLRTIPGVELVGEVQAPPGLDYDCGIASLRLPPEQLNETRAGLMSSVRDETDADTIATISHACHREWCQEGDERLRVRNYISIVAEALGLTTEIDHLGNFKKTDNLEEILDQSKPEWQSYGLNREQARRLASKYFAGGEMAP